MPSASDLAVLWKAGKLSYKLHKGQRELHTHYRGWEMSSHRARKQQLELAGKYPRIYVADCSRRFGKDYCGLDIRIEDAIRRPGSVLTYATAFQKDITEIVLPLFEQITEDCPPALKPVFRGGSQGITSGFYFPNKSLIKLVGIDKNADGLRGKFSDGITISEAAFVDHLKYCLVSVLMPQLQGRLHATIMLNSTPPEQPGHPYDDLFCPDAIERDAYFMRTIEDNPMLSNSEREEFIAAAGGRGAETCEREYFCRRIRSETRVVVPEFQPEVHVRASPEPEYALGFTAIDPGVRDVCAVVSGYYDFERAVLVIRNDWGKTGANTDVVVANLRKVEHDAFGGLQYWDGSKFARNPFGRFSDTDARIITDLNSIHGIKIAATDKTGSEAALHALRNAFQQGKIELHPDAKLSIAHVTNAVWNKSRTSYEHSDTYGHFDAVDAIKYMWRMCSKTVNPFPPAGVVLSQRVSRDDLHFRPEHMTSSRPILTALRDALPKGWKVRR